MNSGRPDVSDPIIDVCKLRKEFAGSTRAGGGLFRTPRVVAVDEVSIQVHHGETVAVVGESGCGKSTLARLVLGLEKPTSGQVRFRGIGLSKMARSERRAFHAGVQAVFQDPYTSLSPRMKVKEIVAEPLRIQRKMSGADIVSRVASLLTQVGLDPADGERYPHQFSGGQRQRVAIARALSVGPEVIVLDEPVSALDVSVRAQTLNLLNDLQDEFGVSYLFISHDLAVVSQIAHRVVVMYLGQVLEEGPVQRIFMDSKHPYTRALLNAVPQPKRTSMATSSLGIQGEVSSADAVPDGCRFHPRCPLAVAACGVIEPRLAGTEERSVRCLAYQECRPSTPASPVTEWPKDVASATESTQEGRLYS